MKVKRNLLVLVAAVSSMAISQTISQTMKPAAPENAPAHTSNSFRFEVHVPMARVAPLFAPEAERGWAGADWNPQFIYPRPGKDVQGAVFTVAHGSHTGVWVNTLFDVPGGRMQYVSFVPDVLVTTVDVRVTALGESRTAVEVTYTRTALQDVMNDHVIELSNKDRDSGPSWKSALETCLGLKAE